MLRASLVANGVIPPGAPVPREYIGQALKEVVMHEVGHTLGLRHNFRATSAIPNDKLRDKAYTATHGTAASVMDYNPPAIALDRRQQGDYYSKTIGLYDRWAIRYGYADMAGATPDAERPALAALASGGANPDIPYGTDEDASFGRFGLDPLTTRYDQGADPLAWAHDDITLVNRLFDSLETRLIAPGQDYARLRERVPEPGLRAVLRHPGGHQVRRRVLSCPGATGATPMPRSPFTAIPAARQREALRLITTAAFSEDAWRFSPALLNRLGPSHWFHWGANPFGEPIDFQLHDWAASLSESVLGLLLDPGVMARMRDNELRVGRGEQVLTLPELFSSLTSAIWAEAGYTAPMAARNVNSIRRDLQRKYLTMLARIVVLPGLGTPDDARALARQTLTDLDGKLDEALRTRGAQLDDYTRAHFADARVQIRKALEAVYVQPGPR